MLAFRAIGLIALLLSGPAAHAARPTSPVAVDSGVVVGLRAGAMRTFLGVPFAAPPVGALRWRAPQPLLPWKGVKHARSFAPACSQTAQWIPNPRSEDCLYLNIWAPEKAAKLPVIVWIHGGGFYGGTAAQPGYDGANLARRGAIVVTLNYRLGILGFFAHPELSAESAERASGNQGILDQIAALRWVKNNIAAFGGDAGRVTIMGESAGGGSVQVLVASPLSKGLFQRAVSESGNDNLPFSADEQNLFDRKAGAEAKGLAAAKAVGARDLSELRKLSVSELHKLAWSASTHVDGHLLREDMSTSYRHQRQNDVPLLVGWNAEEGKDLAPEILGTSEFTAAKHLGLMTELLGHAPSERLLAAYPGATDAEAKASIDQLTTDWWGWRITRWAGLQARHGRSKAYVYHFAHRPAEPSTPCGYGCGAGHGAEIQYLFDNLDLDARPWSAADRQLAKRLADTLIRFASTGHPSGHGLPAWPIFDGSNATVLGIGTEVELRRHPLPDFTLFGRPGE
ncbi:MAG: carboxylesterase family protein [Pseudomonadota bacterium]